MYKFERILNMDVDKAYGKLSQGLKEKGYVILSYVDVKEIIKNKFNEDFPYALSTSIFKILSNLYMI